VAFALLQAGQIVERLLFSLNKTFACALGLNEQDTFPEKVNSAALITKFFDWFFECRDAAARDTENFKKFVIESLRFAALVAGVFPFIGEARSACPNLIPTKSHLVSLDEPYPLLIVVMKYSPLACS
jgi:hypothetical protein